MKHTSKLLAILLAVALLLAAAAVPASAATQCFVCEGVCFYQCSECYGKGAYYYCPVHTEYHWDSPNTCGFCKDGVPLLLRSPCDNGCLWNDDFGCYVTACSFCNGLGVINTRPDPPQNLVLTPGDGFITMTWEAPASDGGSPIIGYKVQRGIEGIDAEVIKVDLGPDVFSYTWDGLKNGTSYTIYIWAVNDVDEGSLVTGECAPEGTGEPSNTFRLWGKQTGWVKTPLAWFFLIVCFGWIWMTF